METNDNIHPIYLLPDDELETILYKPKPGIYMVPAHTGKGWFHRAVAQSSGLIFLREGKCDVVMIAIGDHYCDILDAHKHVGFFVRTHYNGSNSRH